MFCFVETALFTRPVAEYLGEDEYRALQRAVMSPKSVAGSTPAHVLKKIREEVEK